MDLSFDDVKSIADSIAIYIKRTGQVSLNTATSMIHSFTNTLIEWITAVSQSMSPDKFEHASKVGEFSRENYIYCDHRSGM